MHANVASATPSERLGLASAWATLAGIVLSGPLALIALNRAHPQPPWRDAATFVHAVHPAQAFPYSAGFLLVGGAAVLISSLHAGAPPDLKPRTTAALVFTGAFAALVFLNYIVQTTFMPVLVERYAAEDEPIVTALSLANPTSLAWALEMWAWGLFGVATWLVAPVFSRGALERFTSHVFVANGVVSVGSALMTAFRPAWVMTPSGLVGFTLWNILVFAMAALTLVALNRRARATRVGRELLMHAA